MKKRNKQSALGAMMMPAPYGLIGLYDAPYLFPLYEGMPLSNPEEW